MKYASKCVYCCARLLSSCLIVSNKVMMMMMTTFFVGIHGEPGVKRVKVKNAKIMSFCYSVTFACNFTMTEPL